MSAATSKYLASVFLFLLIDMARSQVELGTKELRRQARGETYLTHWIYFD